MNYEEMIKKKSHSHSFDGLREYESGSYLFPHQRDLVKWALRKGRAAVFADTGLGKTAIELEWAKAISQQKGRVLILAPLAVAEQIVREGLRFGIDAKYMRAEDNTTPIVVTNYEMLSHFDASQYAGIVLDESSILKNFTGRTRDELIDTFKHTPYRLAATATPAPNDFTELGNHSEFLGIKTRTEMLAEYFVHDGETTQEWRIKGHAENAFWEWVCSWAAVVKNPSDLGHDGEKFKLPPLNMHEIVIKVDHKKAWDTGMLFQMDTTSLNEQRKDRRETTEDRVKRAVEIAKEPGHLLIWGDLNDECDLLEKSIPDSVQVKGSHTPDEKRQRLEDFSNGKTRIMVTKSSIAGFGMNWQHCSRMVFMGASHSYEQVYQAIRRCWRFGQTKPVEVFILRSETEGAIIANYRRKEADAARFSAEMSDRVRTLLQAEVKGATVREWNAYNPQVKMTIPSWVVQETK